MRRARAQSTLLCGGSKTDSAGRLPALILIKFSRDDPAPQVAASGPPVVGACPAQTHFPGVQRVLARAPATSPIRFLGSILAAIPGFKMRGPNRSCGSGG